MNLPGFMPDLFLDVTGCIGMKPHLYIDGLALIHPEARPHELLKAEILGHLKGLLCLVEHLDPVQGEYPDLISHMAETDQVKGPIEKPDPVRVNPAPGFFLPAHGIIHHLDRFTVDGPAFSAIDDPLNFPYSLYGFIQR